MSRRDPFYVLSEDVDASEERCVQPSHQELTVFERERLALERTKDPRTATDIGPIGRWDVNEVGAGIHQFQVVVRRYGDMAMPVVFNTLIEGVEILRGEHALDALRRALDELRPSPERREP